MHRHFSYKSGVLLLNAKRIIRVIALNLDLTVATLELWLKEYSNNSVVSNL
jgi:hypothetical protein